MILQTNMHRTLFLIAIYNYEIVFCGLWQNWINLLGDGLLCARCLFTDDAPPVAGEPPTKLLVCLLGGNKGSRSSNITDRVEFGVPPPPPGEELELELCFRLRVPVGTKCRLELGDCWWLIFSCAPDHPPA